MGKARELANMTLWEFRHALAARKIPVHVTVADLDQDMDALREIGLL
ncbi:MAG: UPF0175 family protein [Chloroflexota bacterium]